MECPPTPEPAYLNLPGWRCVPVYALPYSKSGSKSEGSAIGTRALLPLNFPSDPKGWTRQQVYTWLEWSIENFSLPPLDVEQFYMNGRGLCLLKKNDWKDRAPRSGDILHNALQLLVERESEDNSSKKNGSLNGGGPVHDNVSAALLHHASLHEKNSLQHLPTHGWPRSISSDFHSMGHVVHDNDHTNGRLLGTNGSDADSTGETSPAPSPEDMTHELNGISRGNADVGSSLLSRPQQMPQLKMCNDKTSVEKINVRLLWDFLQQLLNDEQQRYNGCIMWKDKGRGIFKITDPHRLAGLWGKQKNHLNMNFDKMSRALRYYYRVRILQKEPGERHCYRFLRHPSELRHCKQRSLLTKETTANASSALECSDVEAVLDMSIKEENSLPGDIE